MKKLIIIAVILVMFLVLGCLQAFAETSPNYLQLERKYTEQYGKPTVKIRWYSKELGFDYRVYRWEDIEVVFANDIKQSGHDQWFVYSVLGKCLKCGEYHVEIFNEVEI